MPGQLEFNLMTYPDAPIEGRVDSIGWGIAQQDGSTGFELLPKVTEGGWYNPNGMMLLSPSAFFLIGLFIWAIRAWKPIAWIS